MRDQDIEMNVRFKTHCPKCGVAWMIESVVLDYGAQNFARYVAEMRESLERQPKKCCGKNLPVIGKQWERAWP